MSRAVMLANHMPRNGEISANQRVTARREASETSSARQEGDETSFFLIQWAPSNKSFVYQYILLNIAIPCKLHIVISTTDEPFFKGSYRFSGFNGVMHVAWGMLSATKSQTLTLGEEAQDILLHA